LKAAKKESSRLSLRVEHRNAPYYGVLREFFPDHINKVVDETHTCMCNYCGSTIMASTDQSSNPI